MSKGSGEGGVLKKRSGRKSCLRVRRRFGDEKRACRKEAWARVPIRKDIAYMRFRDEMSGRGLAASGVGLGSG